MRSIVPTAAVLIHALGLTAPVRADLIALPATLAQLTVPGATVEADGLRFSGFTFTVINGTIAPAALTLEPSGRQFFADPPLSLRGNQALSFEIAFEVATLDGSASLSQQILGLTAMNIGTTGVVSVEQSVSDASGAQLASLRVFYGPGSSSQPIDEIAFPRAVSSARVVSVVNLSGSQTGDGAAFVSFSSISNLGAGATIPEPPSALLVASTIPVVAFAIRARRLATRRSGRGRPDPALSSSRSPRVRTPPGHANRGRDDPSRPAVISDEGSGLRLHGTRGNRPASRSSEPVPKS